MSTISHRRALVTGGTRGIGRAVARALRDAGARVVICGRDPAAVDALAAEEGLVGLVADVGFADQRARLIDEAVAELGGLDLLVNNAGIQRAVDWTAKPGDSGREGLEREIGVNLVAPLDLARLAVPHLAQSGHGALVMVTSILALTPKAEAPAYCATKAALRSACASLGAQLRPLGIDVVELVPPLVDTEMTAGRGAGKVSPDEVARALVRGLARGQHRIPVGPARLALALHRLAPGLLARQLLGA